MAVKAPEENVLEFLHSNDENRIVFILSTHIIDFGGEVKDEFAPKDGTHNCFIEIEAQVNKFDFKGLEKVVVCVPSTARHGTTSAFFFTDHKVSDAAINTMDSLRGGNLDKYFQQNQLPQYSMGFPCLFLPTCKLENKVLVWAEDSNGALHISVLKPEMVNHGDDMGRSLRVWGNSTFSKEGTKTSVWGPDDYRRMKKESYVIGGKNPADDYCRVIGVTIEGRWHIYAQKTRPHKRRSNNNKRVWKVVEVWRLFPEDPKRIWSRKDGPMKY